MPEFSAATLDGDRRALTPKMVENFRKKVRGELLSSESPGYETARRVWNGMVDKRPALIARCVETEDVAACVHFAREHQLLVSVRGGGHNYAGKAVCEDGLVIDLSSMKSLEVNPERRRARAQAGLRLGEFDRQTQKFGLATTLGINTDTGISGLTLGGGYGWLAGKHGLACDNLLSAEVVTADGRILRCSKDEYADLFWGLRGAGANFGVVTQLEYQLHQVGTVLGGMVLHPLSKEILRFFDEFSSVAPDELTTAGVVLTGPQGNPTFASIVCYCGTLHEGEKLLEPLRRFPKPIADLIQPRTYLEMQSLLDETWPPGRCYYNKAHNIRKICDRAIETILRYWAILPTQLTNIAFQQLHGAATRKAVNETAFPHRYDHYDLLVHPATDNAGETDQMIQWARRCWEDLQPFVERAVYVNALEDALEEGDRRVREAYGANYDRLVNLKRKYDPMNFFRHNSNINPNASEPTSSSSNVRSRV